MAIQFDQDAVSENIRNLLSQGVGRIEDGVPSFNNADIELHQNIIRRERGLSPISATAPVGINVNTQALDFTGLEDPSRQGLRDTIIKIGELEGKKLENSSRIAAILQNQPDVVAANDMVSSLSEELAMVPLDQLDIRNEIQGELLQATKLAETTRKDAIARAGIQEKRDNALIDADIARLQAQQTILQAEQNRADTAKARRGFSDAVLQIVVDAGAADGFDNADKLLKSAPRGTQEMARRLAVGQRTGNYVEAYDGIIDIGGRKLGEDMIVNGAPIEEQDNVRIALKQNSDRMAVARKLASKEVTGEVVRNKIPRNDAKAIAEREQQLFDGKMRDLTFGGYERVLLQTSSDELDASWFNNNNELLEVGKLVMDMVPPDADNMESAFGVVGQRLISQGIDRDLVIRAMGKIIDSRASSWNTTNKYLGLSVSRKKLENKVEAIRFNIFNLDRIDRSRRQAAESVQAGSAADVGPLGLFGLSELDQAEASGLGVNTPIPEDIEAGGAATGTSFPAPFQAPNIPGLVPSDASRTKLQELAKSIVARATRQQGVPITGPSAQQTGALTPSAASRGQAQGSPVSKKFTKSLQDLRRDDKITEAEMKAILAAFDASPEGAQLILDAVEKEKANPSRSRRRKPSTGGRTISKAQQQRTRPGGGGSRG